MKDDTWIENEIKNLSDDEKELADLRESKRHRKISKIYDNRILFIFVCFMLPLAGMQLIGREMQRRNIETVKSAQWRCKKCHTNCYSECPDWKGDFHCRRCGTKKGKQ